MGYLADAIEIRGFKKGYYIGLKKGIKEVIQMRMKQGYIQDFDLALELAIERAMDEGMLFGKKSLLLSLLEDKYGGLGMDLHKKILRLTGEEIDDIAYDLMERKNRENIYDSIMSL